MASFLRVAFTSGATSHHEAPNSFLQNARISFRVGRDAETNGSSPPASSDPSGSEAKATFASRFRACFTLFSTSHHLPPYFCLHHARISFALGTGGGSAPAGHQNKVESYDGTSFTNESTMVTGANYVQGGGTSTAGLAFGGSGPAGSGPNQALNRTEEWNDPSDGTRTMDVS